MGSRRTKEVVIPAEPATRDSGKTFVVTEMPASQAERWADRAILAVANSGANVDHVAGTGMAGMAVVGFKALFGIKEGIALELAEEMMQCVQIKTAAGARPLNPNPQAEDIEEVMTRWILRAEVFALHTGFSLAEIRQLLISAAQTADSSTIPTSRGRSGQRSAGAKVRSSRR